MEKFFNVPTVCASVLMLVSCVRGDYFAFENVEYVKEFPVTCRVGNSEVLPIDAIGIQGIKVFDDFLLLSCHDSAGCLSAFGKDGGPAKGTFLRTGRGPGEVGFQPFMSWFDFRESEGRMVAGLYDGGRYIEYDIDESLERGRTICSVVADSLSQVSGSSYSMAEDGMFICRRGNQFNTGYERFMVGHDGEEYRNAAMEYLNSITSSENNLVSTGIVYNPDMDIVAEFASRLGVVHFYSLSSDFRKTVVLGRRMRDLREEERLPQDDMMKAYYDEQTFDGFIAGLYLGTTIRELDEGTYAPPQIHLFSWDGQPLACIDLPVRSLFFDIDVREGYLYVVKADTEEVVRYDISSLFEAIPFLEAGV